MDPKQTPPQTGGQTGLPKMAGELGAENLSTGANVARTMNSLNDQNQSAIGAPVFAKHKFDKIEYATGDIILQSDVPKPKGLFSRLFGGKKSSEPQVKSAAEISREARREAKRLRKLRASTDNPVGASTPSNTPVDASAPSNTLGSAPSVSATPSISTTSSASATPSRPRTTRIAVIAIIVVLVAAAGVLGFIALSGNPKKTTSSPTVVNSDATARAAFEDYLSYLFYGDNVPAGDLYDSFEKTWSDYESGDWMYDADDNYNPDAKNPVYAELMMDASSMTDASRGVYFNELNSKWQDFVGVYSGKLSGYPRLNDAPIYFYGISSIGNLTDNDVYSIYQNYKSEDSETQSAVDNKISEYIKTDSTDPVVYDYYLVKLSLYFKQAENYRIFEKGNCESSSDMAECISKNSDEIALLQADAEYQRNLLSDNAYSALKVVFGEIYGEPSGITAEDDE